jgi:hypothetical protein
MRAIERDVYGGYSRTHGPSPFVRNFEDTQLWPRRPFWCVHFLTDSDNKLSFFPLVVFPGVEMVAHVFFPWRVGILAGQGLIRLDWKYLLESSIQLFLGYLGLSFGTSFSFLRGCHPSQTIMHIWRQCGENAAQQ